jgi:hypothetical protein
LVAVSFAVQYAPSALPQRLSLPIAASNRLRGAIRVGLWSAFHVPGAVRPFGRIGWHQLYLLKLDLTDTSIGFDLSARCGLG